MENSVNAGAALFTDEELKDMYGVKICDDHVEVICGCTSRRYGDAVGKLKVFADGFLEIECDCYPGCPEGKLTPSEFEKHSQRETSCRKWKYNIWVTIDGQKTPIMKTPLIKYYDQSSKKANGDNKSSFTKIFHRDEFVKCSVCAKERRFRLRSKEECRFYHDALRNENWKCYDLTLDKVTCDQDEERASRKAYRGCSRSSICKGCTACVCFGCDVCRFSDCGCQTCTDFTSNAKAA